MTETSSPPAPRGRRRPVRYSAAVARRLCARVAKGELVHAVCREAGMPTAEAVRKWALGRPDFAAALAAARRAGGRPEGSRGGVSAFCPETAEAVFERLCEGESLTAIGRDPTMPSLSTLFRWRRAVPAFDAQVRLARVAQAERFCDLGWEMACAATPETAYLTHVRLTQLRWTAGVMAPRLVRVKPVEPEGAPPPRPVDVLIRRFEFETDPQTGKGRVVAWCPNPLTGEEEREDVPGWRPPEGAVLLPGGGGG